MMRMLLALAAVLCVCSADFSLDPSLDALYDLSRLYRMKNLNNFADDYIGDDIDSRSGDEWMAPYGDEMYKDAQFGGTHLRDQEHIEQSSLYGSQALSGVPTIDGKQKPAKNDKPLPAYCNPPNPCPEGYNAKEHNCVENFNNSADNNRQMMAKQDCPCDTEHMFSCAEGRGTVSSKAQGDSAAIKQVMEELGSNMNMFDDKASHHTLVAKKSPELSRNKRWIKEAVPNPYFHGEKKRVVAKKGAPSRYQ